MRTKTHPVLDLFSAVTQVDKKRQSAVFLDDRRRVAQNRKPARISEICIRSAPGVRGKKMHSAFPFPPTTPFAGTHRVFEEHLR